MDPVTIVATVITFAGAVCTSYERISKVVAVVQNAPNELAAIRSQAASINDVVADLKQTIEESDIREAIEKDKRALDHVEKLNRPLEEVQCTLTEVVDKLTDQTRPTTEEGHYKLRWWYYFSTSEWEQLQKRLTAHINVLNISMQGLLTFHVLLALGDRNRDPARILRAYAKSIIEGQEGGESTSVDERKPSPLASSNNAPPFPLPLDERRVLLRRKRGLQRDLLQASQRGDEFEVSLLLGEGAETDWTDENGGMTALHIAARYGHIHAAECLLEAGAGIEAKSDAIGNEWTVRTEKDRTPLI